MKQLMALLAVVAVVGFVGSFALAAETTTKPTVLEGKFVKMDEGKLVMKAGDKETTVLTNDKTTVIVDGKDGGKLADLKAGMMLRVTLTDAADATAAKVQAKTPPATKGEH